MAFPFDRSAAHVVASGTTNTVTFGSAILVGENILVHMHWGFTGGADPGLTITDNASPPNSYTIVGQTYEGVSGVTSVLAYCLNCNGGGTSVTVTTSSAVESMLLVDLFGGAWSLYAATSAVNSDAPSAFASPSVTVPTVNCLVYGAGVAHDQTGDFNGNPVIGAGFTEANVHNGTSVTEYLYPSVAGAKTTTFGCNNHARTTAWILVLKPYGYFESAPLLDQDGNNTAVTTLAAAAPSGSTILLLYGWGDSTTDTATFTDNASGATNVYTKPASQGPILVNSEYWGIAYCTNVAGAPTTVTVTTGSNHSAIALMVDVYVDRWVFVAASNSGSTGAGVATPPALTPPVNGCLIYGTAVATAAGSCDPTSGNGFTERIALSNVWSSADLIQRTASPVSATFTLGSTGIAFEMVLQPQVPDVPIPQFPTMSMMVRRVRTLGY